MTLRAPRALAMAALAALVLSALGQAGLERARLLQGSAPGGAWLLLGAGAAMAVAALGTRLAPADLPPAAFELAPLRWRWILAHVPAALCLVLAAVKSRGWYETPQNAEALRLWLAGLALLFVPGALRAVLVRGSRRPRTGWPRAAVLTAAAALFAAAFFLRTTADIRHLPAWVENDEAITGILARTIFGHSLTGIFGFAECMPSITFLWSFIDLKLFGDDIFGLRLGSAVMGSLTVVLLYDFARRIVGDLPAFLGAALLAVNHVHLNLSRIGHNPVKTPFFAALLLVLLVRVFTGGGLLPLAGAAAVLGIGAVSYPASHPLPAVILVLGAGWALSARLPARRAAAVLGFVGVMGFLVAAPMLKTIWELRASGSLTRVESLSLFDPKNAESLRQMTGAPDVRTAIRRHALSTVSLFNFGQDDFPSYVSERAFLDAVCAALAPAAFLLLLVRLKSPLGWGLWVFASAYLMSGVFLCAAPVTYHRIVVVMLFLGPALAWTVLRLGARIAEGFALPAWTPAALGAAFVAASAFANVDWYFREFTRLRKPEHRTVLTFLACGYAGTHTVLDATALGNNESIPVHNNFLNFQCPTLDRVRVKSPAELWSPNALTTARHVALIVPQEVVDENPGTPSGYRIVKDFVDTTITFPRPIRLHVYEMEREAGKPADDGNPAR